MNFFCFSLSLNQKYRAANFFRPITAKSGRKKAPAKNGSEISIATKNNKKKLHSVEEKSLLMQYHSINIEKLPKRIKKNSFKHCIVN